ncbi:hypothetical protein [Alloactinosynnema sp. L-07]|uniref:hypothetical protein n=1 Tax=Alloactinosynnema sp. L-07 TaxID=1653480 RepID=UPI00065F053B|nr:hypothetical protein [Alloactinosynnema sp. L-07]CRK61038.1 hypothetical protein [Alloactinosynnema sp. L-07]
METWRMIATVLLAVGGVVLMLVTMAKVRERTGSGSTVAITGAIGTTVLVLLCVLTLTALAPPIAWGTVIVVGVVGSVMLLVG